VKCAVIWWTEAVFMWLAGILTVLAMQALPSHAAVGHAATPTARMCVVSDGTLDGTTLYDMEIQSGLWYRRHAVSVVTEHGVTRLVTTLEWEKAK
jgi:hypothetical protein